MSTKSNIPAIRRKAIVIAIPNPGKPNTEASSYRPISLLSPAIKVLERFIFPYLLKWLHIFGDLARLQGIMIHHHCTPPYHRVRHPRLESVQPATIMALDFTKAFETVPHHSLLLRVLHSDLNNSLIRWVAAYLGGRQACCQYQSAHSRFRGAPVVVLQGSVISIQLGGSIKLLRLRPPQHLRSPFLLCG